MNNNDDDIKILNRKAIIVFLVYFIMGFISVTLFVISFVDRKTQSFDGKITIQEDIGFIKPVGNESDPENSTNPAYDYWYAPSNSFGIQQTRSVNWSWFWKVFRKNSMWQLEAWHPVLEEWVSEWQGQNLNEWLNITRVRNETTNASEKITLNVTNMHPTQDLFFRFKFGIDVRVKDYINKSSWYEYTITYPANATENYTVFFNFSDVKPLINNGTLLQNHGVKNDLFYFMLTQNQSRQPLKSGKSFEIDPTFGDTGSYAVGYDIENTIRGETGTPTSNGTADNVTITKLTVSTTGHNIKCALYNNATGAFIAETEEINVSVSALHINISFNFTNVDVYNDIEYMVVAWSENADGSCYLYRAAAGYSVKDSHAYNGWPNPIVNTGSVYDLGIYCSYTESAAETWQLIDYSINGTCVNSTSWSFVDYNINGSCTNTTVLQMIDYSINGTCTNTTVLQMIDYSINGTCTNTSVQLWQMIDYSINGSCTNTTTLTMIDYSINGTCTNDTKTWQLLDYSINGTCTNTTEVFITITDEYPTDEETSAPIQPTVYATINSTTGLTMNVSWYWGTSAGSENTLIGTDTNFTNSTQVELFFEAGTRVTTYYWRAQANDGTNYQNETFSFTTEGYPIAPRPTNTGLMILGLLFGSFGLIALLMIGSKRKEKRRNEYEENIYYYEEDTGGY